MAFAVDSVSTTPAWSVTKLQAILDSPTPSESPSLLSALSAIPASADGTLSRHAITSDIEKGTIEETQKVLDLFKGAQGALNGVFSEVRGMEKDVKVLLERLEKAKIETGAVVQTTGDLRRKLEEAKWKEKAATSFVRKFVLNEEDKMILESGEVCEDYLKALKKLEEIHEDSKLLLRSSNQKLGLDILGYSATTREACYEAVYKFVQKLSANLDSDSVPKILTASIVALRPRPMLLKYCAEEVGSARRASLVTRFVTALTKGGRGGVPRPIELHAHDPLRYTNDMLAWMHQALASEKELIFRLFGDFDDITGTSSEVVSMGGIDNRAERTKAFNEYGDERTPNLSVTVLNTIFGALIRPFRVRFEQALEPTPPVVILFKLATLLEFYADLMGKLLGSDGGIVDMLMECNSITMYAFFSTWKHKMNSFKNSSQKPTENLLPPPAVNQSMVRLDEIMATVNTSLATEDARRGQIAAVLEVILTPLLSLCENISNFLSPLDSAMYMANCMNAMKTPLQGHSYAAERVENLNVQAEEYVAKYIQLATAEVLKRAGLYERVSYLRDSRSKAALNTTSESSSEPNKAIPGMDVEGLSISVKNFYAMLFSGSGESLAAPRVEKITDIQSRNKARIAVANEIVRAHDELYAFVDDMVGGERVGMRDPKKVKIVLTGRV